MTIIFSAVASTEGRENGIKRISGDYGLLAYVLISVQLRSFCLHINRSVFTFRIYARFVTPRDVIVSYSVVLR